MINRSSNWIFIQIKIKVLIILLLMGVLLFTIISSTVKAVSQNGENGKNTFFLQLLNYTLPAIKVSNFEKQDMADNDFSIKDVMLKIVGIDSKNPMSILGKEVSCISEYDNKLDIVDNNDIPSLKVDIKPFALNDSEINKSSNDSGNTNPSLPNDQFVIDDPSLKNTNGTSKPEILIYHTHTSEAYGEPDTSQDVDRNVCAVGDALAKELRSKYGISVIHDTTIHDAQDYNNSYTKSRATIDKYLKEYGNFKLIIDIHRDSSPLRSAVTMNINGQNVARYMFVVDGSNPHYQSNLALVDKMVGISEKLFPGYIMNGNRVKGIYNYTYGKGHFNQDKATNAILIEVGSQVSTAKEAVAAAPYLARVIAEALNGKN